MKKEYKILEIETVTFEADDVITASGCDYYPMGCECDGVTAGPSPEA